MIIAVNTTVVETNIFNNKSNFIIEVFKRIAQQNPQLQFIFIFDKAHNKDILFSKNITSIIVKSLSKNALTTKYWYNVKLPLALKKYKVDLVIQTAGLCSQTTKIPQILMIDSGADKLQTKHLAITKHIITSSFNLKNEIIATHQIDKNNISVVYGAANDTYKPLNYDEIMQTKDGFADGREYFLLINDGNLITVVKAFSLFKKWQHSNMKLLVVGNFSGDSATWNKLNTYKYRDDLVLLDNIHDTQLKKLIASAYCVVYPSLENGFDQPIIQSMQSGVPIITNNTQNTREIGGEATLYANSNSFEAVTEKMQLIYKDEILRSKLIKDGLQQATQFSWDKTASLMKEIILASQKID
jgi:glycosyltransferase involved in cell wall biosynthesis